MQEKVVSRAPSSGTAALAGGWGALVSSSWAALQFVVSSRTSETVPFVRLRVNLAAVNERAFACGAPVVRNAGLWLSLRARV